MSPSPEPLADLDVILDRSALVAAGRGNVLASRLIHRAHDPSAGAGVIRLHTAACALVEADRERRGTGMHVAALPSVTVIPLDLSAAIYVRAEEGWALPHTLHAAEPSIELPQGAIVATVEPEAWSGRPVRILDLRS